MISDVLFEAIEEIDRYLHDDAFAGVYAGETRARIVRLRGDMETLRQVLDTPEVVYADAETWRKVRIAAMRKWMRP